VPQDLTVAANQTVALDATRPDAAVAGALTVDKVEVLSDLVRLGFVESENELDRMIAATKVATAKALSDPGTLAPINRVAGRRTLMDLGRFPRVLAEMPEANRPGLESVWRIVREVEPTTVDSLSRTSKLADMRLATGSKLISKWDKIHLFVFQDITVLPGAVLEVAADVHVLNARDIHIQRTGRIAVRGGSLRIIGKSIKGEQ